MRVRYREIQTGVSTRILLSRQKKRAIKKIVSNRNWIKIYRQIVIYFYLYKDYTVLDKKKEKQICFTNCSMYLYTYKCTCIVQRYLMKKKKVLPNYF